MGAKVWYSPDFFGVGTDDAVYVEGNVGLALPFDVTLAGHIGYQTVNIDGGSDIDYEDFKVALSREFFGFGVEAAYTTVTDDVDACGGGSLCSDHVLLTVWRSF